MNTATEISSVGASRILANHIAKAAYDNLSEATRHSFKRTLLDFLTCAVAGSAMPVSKALLEYFQENDATRAATVIGTGARLSVPNAALVNGANTHGLDFDDGFTQGSCHPAGAIFPAVFALAEQRGCSAREMILAAAIRYDVMLRIAAAMHPTSARRGYHNTPLAGVFGATAAAASMLKLDPERALDALGLAGSFSAGIREYLDEGAEIKRIHPGKAARDGVLCAEFAQRGISGPSKILEGRYGFFQTHVGSEVKWQQLLAELGRRFEIDSVYFKPYPCCRHYHAVIDGIKALKREYTFAAADVANVHLGIYGVGVHGHDHKHYDTLLDAQMSAPCAAGLAILFGDVTAQMFLPATLGNSELAALIERIDSEVDAECERIYPGTRSGFVRIELRDGRKLEKRVIHPKGEVENPMTDADLENKFIGNCEPIIGKTRCARLLEQVWRFDALDDVSEFFKWG